MIEQRAKSWVEINAGALEHNIQKIRSLLNKEVAFCSVVKANAYGHGLEAVVQTALNAGIECFAVDSIDEAETVRKITEHASIFILGFTPMGRIADVVRLKCVQVVYDEHTIKVLGNEASKQNIPAFVNVKVETGTQRQGVVARDFKHLLAAIEKQQGQVIMTGLASHFSSSEDTAKSQVTQGQNEIFKSFQEECRSFGMNPKFSHISCSASTLSQPETHHSLVRIGIAQYGMWPSSAIKIERNNKQPSFDLLPVLAWKTQIAQVKDIESGSAVGYDQTFVSDRPMRIAILPIGYYDGFVRALAKKAHVIIRGQQCRVLGNICMNMCIVDISSLPQVSPGDIVTLIGRDGMNEISAEDHANWSKTINYEVTTRINPLLPRIVV